MRLLEFQQRFAARLLRDGDDPLDDGLEAIIRDGGLSAERRIGVYRNNVRENLTGSLRATYPAVFALVGEDFFRMLAWRYLRRHPSTSGDLHAFGGQFAAFLPTVAEAATLPYLADVARMEWHYHEVFHAADAEPVAVTALGDFEASTHHRLRLVLHPASALVSSAYPLLPIWQLAIHGGDHDIDLDTGGQHLLVARRGLEMSFQHLAAAESAFLASMLAGENLAGCHQRATAACADFDLLDCLARQFRLGNIVGVGLDDETGEPRESSR